MIPYRLSLALLAPLAFPNVATPDENHSGHEVVRGPLVELVRQATKLFRNPSYALSMGYEPGPCVSGPNGGAMGVHFVKTTLVDDAPPDVNNPEAIIYEPQPGGGYRLVGVEK